MPRVKQTVIPVQIGRTKSVCGSGKGRYELAGMGTHFDPVSGFNYDGFLQAYCASEWHRFTGIVLRKGQVVNAEFRHNKTGFSVRVKK